MPLSDIQKQKFQEISGHEYTGNELKGSFQTQNAYNDERGKNHSPWIFTYIIEPETGNLICELDHRMTSNRIYGWDRNGNVLPSEITEKYFTQHW